MKNKYRISTNSVYMDGRINATIYKGSLGVGQIHDQETKNDIEDIIEAYPKLIELLRILRQDTNLWRIPKVGGCDMYQGLPPATRHIDALLKELKEDENA